MKKLWFVIFLLFFGIANIASSETWHKANQITIGWDVVTNNVDGDPIPVEDIIKYNVYIKDKKTSTETLMTETDVNQVILSFTDEGFYYIGVQAARYIPDDTEPILSTISWSSDVSVCLDGVTFGVRYHVPPGGPQNIKTIQ